MTSVLTPALSVFQTPIVPSRAKPMTLDWQPTNNIDTYLHLMAVPKTKITDALIGEFISYYSVREGLTQTQRQWEQKLAKWAKNAPEQRAAVPGQAVYKAPEHKPNNTEMTDNRQAFIDSMRKG